MPRLVELKPVEVSLVGRPANQREFLLFKSEDTNKGKAVATEEKKNDAPQVSEELAAVLTEKTEGEDSLDGQPEAAIVAYRLVSSLDEDARAQVAAAADLVSTEKGADEETDDDPVLKGASDEVRQEFETLRKELNAERDRRITSEFVQKADQDFSHLPETADKLGRLLKDANENMSEEHYDLLLDVLKRLDAQVEETELMKSQGRAGDGETTNDAMEELRKHARELVEKGDASSVQEGIGIAARQHPDLVREARGES